MTNINHVNSRGFLEASYHFLSESKVGATAGLVGAVALTAFALFCSRYGAQAKPPTWQEKLEELRAKNSIPTPPLSEGLPEECLQVLSFLAQTGNSPDLFKKPLPSFEPTNEKLKRLMEECQTKTGEELYLSIAGAFLENLPALNAFIHAQTQAILLQRSPNKEESKRFTLVNKQIRMILLFLLSHEPKKAEYLQSYKEHVKHAFGNRKWGEIHRIHPINYFVRLIDDLKKGGERELFKFIHSFSIYRRQALLRLRPTKIEARSTCTDVALKTLLSANWFHGTRAITCLKETDFLLIPSGWQHQMDFISFFGEMAIGAHSKGVNAHSLSGTYLDRVDWAVHSYAKGHPFDITGEMTEVDKFLKMPIETYLEKEGNRNIYYCSLEFWDELPRMMTALKRLARWDQAAFKEKQSLLRSKLKIFKQVIEKTKEIKPKEIYNNHNNYYSGKFEIFCNCVNEIERFLSGPLPAALTEAQKEGIKGNFPAVLGSMTLSTRPIHYDDLTGEYLVHGTAQLGKDVQLLCVEEGNLEKAKKWVEDHLSDLGDIRIFSFEQLKEAQKINKMISPYLADILSLNKFQRLCVIEERLDVLGEELGKEYNLRFFNSTNGRVADAQGAIWELTFSSHDCLLTLEEGQQLARAMTRQLLDKIFTDNVFARDCEKQGRQMTKECVALRLDFRDRRSNYLLPPSLAQIRLAGGNLHYYYAHPEIALKLEDPIIEPYFE